MDFNTVITKILGETGLAETYRILQSQVFLWDIQEKNWN